LVQQQELRQWAGIPRGASSGTAYRPPVVPRHCCYASFIYSFGLIQPKLCSRGGPMV
jgi:hypothetical protein